MASEENQEYNQELNQSHLKHFWDIVTFKKLPQTLNDVRMLVQTEMMKFHSRTIICKVYPIDTDKYTFSAFVKAEDKDYFCNNSKLLIKESSTVRDIIDMIVYDDMKWGIETNLVGAYYLIASWKHWGEKT